MQARVVLSVALALKLAACGEREATVPQASPFKSTDITGIEWGGDFHLVDQGQTLLRRFSLFGPPGIIFFVAQGKGTGYRVIGYESADKFLNSLSRAWVNGSQEVIGQR